MLLKLFVPFIVCMSARAETLSVTVGQVSDHVVTSREVLANLYVDRELFSGPLVPSDIQSKAFAKKVNAVLIEWVVYNEAMSLSAPDASMQTKIRRYLRRARARVGGKTEFKKLEFTNAELKNLMQRKLVAKEFIQFKASSSVVPITDAEARDYYNSNRKKFGNSAFTSLKSNIKNYLNRKQVDERMKAWFEILQSKYKVKNIVL